MSKLLSTAAACEALSISRRQLFRLIKAGEFRVVKMGPRCNRIPQESIEAFVKRRTR